jgi:hypothetical protein
MRKTTYSWGKTHGEAAAKLERSRNWAGKNNLGGGKYCGTRPHID